MRIAQQNVHPLEELGLEHQQSFLVTTHLAENVDDPICHAGIISGLKKISTQFDIPVIFPTHPRTQKIVREFSLSTERICVSILSDTSNFSFWNRRQRSSLSIQEEFTRRVESSQYPV